MLDLNWGYLDIFIARYWDARCVDAGCWMLNSLRCIVGPERWIWDIECRTVGCFDLHSSCWPFQRLDSGTRNTGCWTSNSESWVLIFVLNASYWMLDDDRQVRESGQRALSGGVALEARRARHHRHRLPELVSPVL